MFTPNEIGNALATARQDEMLRMRLNDAPAQRDMERVVMDATKKVRDQYDRGLLTFDEFVEDLFRRRNDAVNA